MSRKPGPLPCPGFGSPGGLYGNADISRSPEVFLPILLPPDNLFLCCPRIFLITQGRGRKRPDLGRGIVCLTSASERQPFWYLYFSDVWCSEDLPSWRRAAGFVPAGLSSRRRRPVRAQPTRLGVVAPEGARPQKSLIAEQSPSSEPSPPPATAASQ